MTPLQNLSQTFDVLVVGAGAAGLYTALCLPDNLTIGLITKDTVSLSASDWAQGGIAAAMSKEDSPLLHLEDTIAAGAGLCDFAAVNFLAQKAPSCIQSLVSMGVAFDRQGEQLALTLEAAHSRRRVLHAADTTGKEVITTLTAQVLQRKNISILQKTLALSLWIAPTGRCQGISLIYENRVIWVRAKAIVLATGGGGQVFAHTTNPAVSTGDGVAMSWRSGATVRDLEFVQFHPTALTIPGANSFLISEAVRGEGAHLVDDTGRRFAFDYHPKGELAPRDVVSRAIFTHIQKNATDPTKANVWLDLRPIPADKIRHRFPNIIQVCQRWGIDVFNQPIPVAPAAHYWMGGIVTDLKNRTSLPGLYAVGETASTGVHGANRLASNSLLECIVFGAEMANLELEDTDFAEQSSSEVVFKLSASDWDEQQAVLVRLRAQLPPLVWQSAGICREQKSLESGIAQVEIWRKEFANLPLSQFLFNLPTAQIGSFADSLVRLQPDKGVDPRLLVVAVDEEDISNLGKWPASDRVINQLLDKLNEYQHAAIGLDIYRNLPIEPGNPELVTNLQLTDNIIAVCKSANGDRDRGVAPPKEVPIERLGFSDIVVDNDGVVRRNLLTLTPAPNSACPAQYSFSFQLALNYLAKQGIKLEKIDGEYWKLGKTTFTPIKEDTAEYQNVDPRGYQILFNYRAPKIADQISLTDVLQGKFDPKLVKGRVVLIGVTAISSNDFLYTPYSKGQRQYLRTPGVVVHAQAVSQILSGVLDNKALFWTMPEWAEIPWIFVWSLAGGVIAWRLRNPLAIALTEAAATAGLFGIGLLVFSGLGKVPLVPPAIALLLTGASVASYKGYKNTSLVEQLPVETTNSTNYQELDTQLPPSEDVESNFLDRRYKVVNNIGKGGFGETYLAEDTKRPGNPYCVVKQLKPTRTDERFLELARKFFTTEAQTLEKVGTHDRIPRLLANFEANKEFYLVQEYIKGHSLSDELTPGKKLSEPYVVALLKDVIEVLQFIHGFGVIHRDIKPGNVMRREADGRLVLIDFGAVKQIETNIAGEYGSTVAIGTSGYAPPEQLLGQPLFNSDIYALGMLGIQALVGMPSVQIPKDPVTKEVIWRDRAQVSDKLAAILDKMVAYRHEERYQSAMEVSNDLQQL